MGSTRPGCDPPTLLGVSLRAERSVVTPTRLTSALVRSVEKGHSAGLVEGPARVRRAPRRGSIGSTKGRVAGIADGADYETPAAFRDFFQARVKGGEIGKQ